MSRQFLDMSISVLYSSDFVQTIKWYHKVLGFELLEINPERAVMQMAPGRIIHISNSADTERFVCFISNQLSELRQHLGDLKIEINNDDGNYGFGFNDLDQNSVWVWSGGFGMEIVQHHYNEAEMHNRIRCYLADNEDLHFIAKKIAAPDELAAVSEQLVLLCNQVGMELGGEATLLISYSDNADEFYAGIPVRLAPSNPLPEGMEYINLPQSDHTVFPFHRSRLENLKSQHLPELVNAMSDYFIRPQCFYILGKNITDAYIEFYIPYEPLG